MASPKYTNIYTVLDKAKKGELVTSNSSSLFKSIVHYKRPDIIRPNVHYLDEMIINRFVINHVSKGEKISEFANFLGKNGINKSNNDVHKEVNDILGKFPKGLQNDFFNLFNRDMDRLKFSTRDESNKLRYQFIEKANQPVHKIMTIGSNTKSLIYTQHVMEYFMKVMLLKKFKNKEEFEQMQEQMKQEMNMAASASSGQGSSQPSKQQAQNQPSEKQEPQQDSGDEQKPEDNQGQDDSPQDSSQGENQQGQPSNKGETGDQSNQSSDQSGKGKSGDADLTQSQLEKMLSQMLNSQDEELDTLLDKAQQTCEKLEEAYGLEDLNKIWKEASLGTVSTSVLDPKELEALAASLKSIKMAMGGVKQFIKKIVDKSVSYFSSKEDTTFEPLMESGHVDQVQDIYMLHPKLRKFMIDDIMVKETKKVGKIDLYIDNSGSMSSGTGAVDEEGRTISRINFAKGFAIKMIEMDLLNNIYTFNDSVRKRSVNIHDIARIAPSGGTDTSHVVKYIKKENRNAIVITDGSDNCNVYSDKAYFIGTQGAHFGSFSYLDHYKDQMCVFDGKSVKKVNDRGQAY